MTETVIADFEESTSVLADEDELTLAAIDEGLLDSEAGRKTPIDHVRELLPKWITASSLRKER